MAEVMRSCLLRAGLSRSRGAASYVLGNPKGWLGTAYHEVLEKLAEITPSAATLDATVEQLWDVAITRQHQRAQGHSLDARFGQPTTWPGYHLARAAVRLRAEEMMRASTAPLRTGAASGAGSDIREQEFTAFNGKLLGRPDVIRTEEIVDYKSGALVEFDEATQTEVVKAAYVRQLRIYGYLVEQALGRWLARGVLLPLAGAGVHVALDPVDCTREAEEAVALLDEYNARLGDGRPPKALAAPSPTNCKWCPFKLICPAFWETASPPWSGALEAAAVEGALADSAHAIHAGAAHAISVDVESGTEQSQRAEIAPLNPSVHTIAAGLSAGDRVRLVGLRVRQDGRLVPTPRTVLARVSDLPPLVMGTPGST